MLEEKNRPALFEFFHKYKNFPPEISLKTNDMVKACEWAKTYLTEFEQCDYSYHFLRKDGKLVDIREYAEITIRRAYHEDKGFKTQVCNSYRTTDAERAKWHARYLKRKEKNEKRRKDSLLRQNSSEVV